MAARENIQVDLACPSIRPAHSKQPPQKQDSRIGLSLVESYRNDVETVPYPLSADGFKLLYMSGSEDCQIERRPNRFTITWAQIIVKFMVGLIVKYCRYDMR